MITSLAEELRESETNPFLKAGPPAAIEGWEYRDFRAMPQSIWLELIDFLGKENIKFCAVNSRFLPPAKMCRAQIWISPKAQELWKDYLQKHTN